MNVIGVVNYYRDVCSRRSHGLVPLTRITSNKGKLKWTKIKQDAFDEINRIVARDNLLTYLGFYETSKIRTDDGNSN